MDGIGQTTALSASIVHDWLAQAKRLNQFENVSLANYKKYANE
jgi:hypothetical protein